LGGLSKTGCRILEGSVERGQWETLAASASPFHGPTWHEAIQVLGHRSVVLCTGKPKLTGVLPLVFRRSRLLGRSLVTAPAANRGGLVAADEESRVALLRGAWHLARQLRASYVEIRDDVAAVPGLDVRQVSDRHVSVEVSLDGGQEHVSRRIRKRTRRYARAASRDGFVVEFGRDVVALDTVYAETMRRRGSPRFGRGFFEAILRAFSERAEVAVVRRGTEIAAADLLVRDGNTQYSLFAGSKADLHSHRPNDMLVHAELMRACTLGLQTFDLGRSPAGSSSLQFKRGFGGVVVPLTYSYLLRSRREPPGMNPEHFPWDVLARLWSNLPEPVADRLGPRLVRHLH
jgi:FemAB-related protein (PEP-CTERM system-associated)